MRTGPEKQILDIGVIELEWSGWHKWEDIITDDRGVRGIHIPNKTRGVYEVRHSGCNDERLTIGKDSDLRMRVRQGLVKGKTKHSTGTRIRKAAIDTGQIEVRWAVTERPAAAEEELHRLYTAIFGRLPEFTKVT